MPEQPNAKPFTFDEVSFKDNIAKAKAELMKNVGKKGHNPFLVIANSITPLETKFANGDKSEELFKASSELGGVTSEVVKYKGDEAVVDAKPLNFIPGINLGSKK